MHFEMLMMSLMVKAWRARVDAAIIADTTAMRRRAWLEVIIYTSLFGLRSLGKGWFSKHKMKCRTTSFSSVPSSPQSSPQSSLCRRKHAHTCTNRHAYPLHLFEAQHLLVLQTKLPRASKRGQCLFEGGTYLRKYGTQTSLIHCWRPSIC